MSQINIGNLTIDKFYLGDSSNLKIYLGEIKLYPTYVPPTPSGNCYKIISTPITSYTSTDYSSVYSFADKKWYMLNNLNQYEEYGIYETGTSLSDFTYYPNKLVVIGETEYQYQTNGWVDVGNYIVKETSYQVTRDMEALRGKELPTTFKIPYSDIDAIRHLDLRINTEDGSELEISDRDYSYIGNGIYDGTVTNDRKYYYYSLPSDAPSSVIIEYIKYYEPTPIRLIFSSRQVPVQYAEKEVPTAKVYNTVEEMEALGCPTVGINQYGVVGNDVYQFEETEEWVNKAKSSLKFIAKYNNDNANVIVCNTSNELSSDDTQPSYLSKDAMTEVYIGNCVTSIGQAVFNGCTSLTSITIPSGVTTIGYDVFNGCTSLTSITIPNSVTSIGASAFQSCTSLTSVTIPSGVTSISDAVFFSCSRLTSITIPSGVTTIGYDVFNGCTSLTSITIPNSVTSIGSSAFNNTPWWNTYSADTSHHYGNIIYINDVAYKATSSGITSCTFREGTVSISASAFSSCKSLTSVTIPSGVTSIENYTFNRCSSLTSVTIGSGVTTIGYDVFNGCTSLKSITIPNSVTTIRNNAFYGCTSLTSVTIGSGVTTIGGTAFYGCTKLTSVTIKATTPPTLGSNVFNNTNNCPIYVPAESVDAYKSATNWSSYASRIKAIN